MDAPRITSFRAREGVTIPPGKAVTLEAAADGGTPPYAYEFFHDGVSQQNSSSPKFAASKPGAYTVMAQGAAGEISDFSTVIYLMAELKAR